MKVAQPFRNPGEYAAYLEGVKATAALFGLKVDSQAWGGGIPTDLTLYKEEEKPGPVVVAEIENSGGGGESWVELKQEDDEPDAGTE